MIGCTSLPILNSGVTGSNFTKFMHNVARSSNLLKSEWRYSKPFWSVKATNENDSANFTYFDPKLVAMATSLEQSEKDGQITNYQSNTYGTIQWKFGENLSGRSWDSFAQRIIKK